MMIVAYSTEFVEPSWCYGARSKSTLLQQAKDGNGTDFKNLQAHAFTLEKLPHRHWLATVESCLVGYVSQGW